MLRIVLVDDEPAILRRLSSIIPWEECGCRIVATAADGEDGIAAVREHGADLVIADIRMPVIDGLRLAELVSGLDNPPDVILLTGYGEFEYARTALRLGVSDYLLKPVDPEKLVEAVLSVRGRREVATEADMEQVRRSWARSMAAGAGGGGSGSDALIGGDRLGFQPGRSSYFGVIVSGWGRTPGELVEVATAAGAITIEMNERRDDAELLLVLPEGASRETTEIGRLLLNSVPAHRLPATVIGVGRVVHAPAKIASTMHEASRSVAYSFYRGGGVMVESRSLPPESTAGDRAARVRPRVEAIRTRLCSLIATMDAEGLPTVLDELARAFHEEMPSPSNAREMLLSLSTTIRMDFGGETDLRDRLVALEPPIETLDICVDALEAQITDLVIRRGAKWGVRTEPISRWVLRYIAMHYNEPITLKSIAEVVNLNPVYLGQRFRNETGKSFHDALLATRMEVAAKALRASHTPIHTIAKQVGYGASVNFYKGFRRVHGTSPAEYRRRAIRREE